MRTLVSKIEALERKMGSDGDVPQWSVIEAERIVASDQFRENGLTTLNQVMEKAGKKPWEIKPESFPNRNKTVLEIALELASKYESLEDYNNKKPPMDIEKLRKIMRRKQ